MKQEIKIKKPTGPADKARTLAETAREKEAWCCLSSGSPSSVSPLTLSLPSPSRSLPSSYLAPPHLHACGSPLLAALRWLFGLLGAYRAHRAMFLSNAAFILSLPWQLPISTKRVRKLCVPMTMTRWHCQAALKRLPRQWTLFLSSSHPARSRVSLFAHAFASLLFLLWQNTPPPPHPPSWSLQLFQRECTCACMCVCKQMGHSAVSLPAFVSICPSVCVVCCRTVPKERREAPGTPGEGIYTPSLRIWWKEGPFGSPNRWPGASGAPYAHHLCSIRVQPQGPALI